RWNRDTRSAQRTVAEFATGLCPRHADLRAAAHRKWIHRLDFICVWPGDDYRRQSRFEISLRLRSAPHFQYLWQPAAPADAESQRSFYIWQRHAAARFLSDRARRIRNFAESKPVARSCLSADRCTTE